MKSAVFAALCVLCCSALQELTASNYKELVENDDQVWIIEVASKMCGSCKELAPVFQRFAKKAKDVKTGVVYMENKEGMKLASSLPGALDYGLPAVIAVVRKDHSKLSLLVKGEPVTDAELNKLVRGATTGLSKNADGILLRSAGDEL